MVQFCPKCGMRDPDDNAAFCKWCGNRFPLPRPEKTGKICAACRTLIADPQAVFCDRCGTPVRADPAVQARRAAGVLTVAASPVRRRCPSCGAVVTDRVSVYCNKCGGSLVPETPSAPVAGVPPSPVIAVHAPPAAGTRDQCPSCGSPVVDAASEFCNKCGANLSVPAPGAAPASAAASSGMKAECCPSCGTPVVDAVSDFCNKCGANLRVPAPGAAPAGVLAGQGPAPVAAGTIPSAPAPAAAPPPSPEGAGPGTPPQGSPGTPPPAAPPGRRPFLKWGLAAGIAVIALLIIAAALSGLVPGTGQSGPDSGTTPVTTTPAPAPVRTQTPAKTVATPTTMVTTTTPVPTRTVTPAVTTNTTNATAPANVTATVTATLAITNTSQPLPIGQSAYDGTGNLTVNDFTFRDKMSDPTPSYAVGKRYLIVNISYENLQANETVDADLSRMRVTDGGGFPFEPASDAILENPYTGKAILPGEKRTGNLLFIVPPEATFLKLEYKSGSDRTFAFRLT